MAAAAPGAPAAANRASPRLAGSEQTTRHKGEAMKKTISTAMALVALGTVPLASAAELTREEYVARAEPICKRNTEANKRIFAGAKEQVKSGKLMAASTHFARASAAFEKTIRQLEAIPQPGADEARLAKWIGYLALESSYLDQDRQGAGRRRTRPRPRPSRCGSTATPTWPTTRSWPSASATARSTRGNSADAPPPRACPDRPPRPLPGDPRLGGDHPAGQTDHHLRRAAHPEDAAAKQARCRSRSVSPGTSKRPRAHSCPSCARSRSRSTAPDGSIDKGLPTCHLEAIEPATETEAQKICHRSIVGSGHVTVQVHIENQPAFPVKANLLAFNGPTEHGRKLILAAGLRQRPTRRLRAHLPPEENSPASSAP